jgi:hypothetical protein
MFIKIKFYYIKKKKKISFYFNILKELILKVKMK